MSHQFAAAVCAAALWAALLVAGASGGPSRPAAEASDPTPSRPVLAHAQVPSAAVAVPSTPRP